MSVGVGQLAMTPTTLSSDWKWQVGQMPQGSWLYGTEVAYKGYFHHNPFYLFALSGQISLLVIISSFRLFVFWQMNQPTGTNAWPDSWSLNILLDGIDCFFLLVVCSVKKNKKNFKKNLP